MTCRQLTRLRYRLVNQASIIKQLVNSRLHPVWPEYEGFFSDKFGSTSLKLLQIASTPKEVLELEPDDLVELIHKTSRGKLGNTHAQWILRAAKESIGMQRGHHGISIGIKVLLEHIKVLKPLRKKLDADIKEVATRLPEYLFTLPGATVLTIVSLYGQVDPIETFANPSKLVAFAGLDPKVFQTGQYDAPHRQISKRGSPYLRHTLWQMAHRAVYHNNELRIFWRNKRRQNKHHFVAVTAVANKWRAPQKLYQFGLEGIR